MTAKKSAKRFTKKASNYAAKKSTSRTTARKNPKGGLTAKGRAYFAKTEGAHLKAGVIGAADTPEKMRRKGSFLRRFYTHLRGPLVNDKGEPTRLALAAHAWGEAVPKTAAAARKLAEKGERLLARYAGGKAVGKKAARKKASSKKTAGRKTAVKKGVARKAAKKKSAKQSTR